VIFLSIVSHIAALIDVTVSHPKGFPMTNIVELKTRTTIVNESCVELLEEWLERARSGEIHTVAIAGLTDQSSSITQWSEIDHVQALLGALRILEARVVRQVVDFD
jgi:hypothetical protein